MDERTAEAATAVRILVVDDEPSIVDAVATALRYEGFDVEEATNGRDAIAAVGPTEAVSAPNLVSGHLSRRDEAYNFPCPFPGKHGGRACGHQNLTNRADHVSVVVVVGRRDLSWLQAYGNWTITQTDDITIARRVGTSPH